MSKKTVSLAWQVFTKQEEKIVQCTECKATLAYHKTTSTMMTHLKSKHPLKYAELLDAKTTNTIAMENNKRSSSGSYTQPKVDESIKKRLLYDVQSPRRKEIDRLILDMVVLDMPG